MKTAKYAFMSVDYKSTSIPFIENFQIGDCIHEANEDLTGEFIKHITHGNSGADFVKCLLDTIRMTNDIKTSEAKLGYSVRLCNDRYDKSWHIITMNEVTDFYSIPVDGEETMAAEFIADKRKDGKCGEGLIVKVEGKEYYMIEYWGRILVIPADFESEAFYLSQFEKKDNITEACEEITKLLN